MAVKPQLEDRRKRWAEQWSRPGETSFHWRTSEPPTSLGQVLATLSVPPGAALDLGCGDGVSSRFLAERFSPTIGVDFAPEAVRQALVSAESTGSPARFAAADVTASPFADSSFSFLFDRGCFHTLPRSLRTRYFTEMERLLRPGGVLFLMAARDVRHKGLSPRALRQRVNRLLRRGRGLRWPTESLIRELAPASLEVIELQKEIYHTPATKVFFNRFLFRKSDSARQSA